MLEHLVSAAEADYVPDMMAGDATFDPLEDSTPAQTLNAQFKTSQWLSAFEDDDEEAYEVTTACLNNEQRTSPLSHGVCRPLSSLVCFRDLAWLQLQ